MWNPLETRNLFPQGEGGRAAGPAALRAWATAHTHTIVSERLGVKASNLIFVKIN